jgi:hypothetical protein
LWAVLFQLTRATRSPDTVLQVESITRRFAAALAALAVLAAGEGVAKARHYAQDTGPGDAAGEAPAEQEWRDAPEHRAILAPAAARGQYRAAVSPLALDAVLQALAADPAFVRVPGAWSPRARLPADAFGRGGRYDRWRLARLYGSRQPRVARGARVDDGGVVESWTLVSPYPSPDLTRLDPGTLLIVLRIAQ